MEHKERKHYESPTSAEGFRGRFATHFFGLTLGEPTPPGKLPHNLTVESSADGRVHALRYQLWNSPHETYEVIAADLSARFGAPRESRDGGREVSWIANGLHVQLDERMLDPGPKLTLYVHGVPDSDAPGDDREQLEALLGDTFSELDNVSVSRKDAETLAITADLQGDDFAGVIVNWRGPAMLEGALQPALVDRVLEELRDAQAEADEFDT
ncbi:MAG: hypothetical protein ACRBN8_21800 [Nannocystales bacterium]